LTGLTALTGNPETFYRPWGEEVTPSAVEFLTIQCSFVVPALFTKYVNSATPDIIKNTL
jgi:hypothetical protein